MSPRSPRPAQRPSPEPLPRSSDRAKASARRFELPAAWTERLLAVWSALPESTSLPELGQAFVDAIAEILPDCAVGLCLAVPQEEGGPFVLRNSPHPVTGTGGPTRLFDEWADELVIPLPNDPAGSTLHCASMAPLPSAGLESLFLRQAAGIIAGTLRSARAELSAAHAQDELHELKAQVVQSQKLAGLGQIAAGIVHELNNPLTSIIAYSGYLEKKGSREGADPSDLERLRRISEAAERIRTFARDLVAYARPSNETYAPVAIHAVIDRALVFCEHVLADSGIEVERRFSPDAPVIWALPGQLTQVFVNLVTNACHAMAQGGGRLILATQAKEGGVRVHVEDTGEGIAKENLPRVFDPFFTTKADGRGSGLGLAIVHDILLAHGGTVAVESEPGSGTRFVLELPTNDQAKFRSSR